MQLKSKCKIFNKIFAINLQLMKTIDNFKQDVGSRLRDFAKNKGLNQSEFSEIINQNNTTISAIFRGKSGISSDVAYAIIMNYPDLSWDWLFKNEGEMIKGSNIVVGEQNTVGAMIIHETPSEYLSMKEELIMLRDRMKGMEHQLKGMEDQIKLKDQIIELLKNNTQKY